MISAILPIKANNPYVNALKLHGDVSCVKIYAQWWSTKFGEMVLDGNKADLKATLYYDKDHRLLYEDDPNDLSHYFYEYTYKDGALTTIDCYTHNKEFNDTIYELSFKIKLTKENGITVAHVYNSNGYETLMHSPYNAIESYHAGILSKSSVFWEPSLGYFYIFAFEIKATKPIYSTYNYNYNSKKQLSSMTGNKFIKFDYDDKGNITYMEIHNEFNERINPYRPIYIVETSYQQTGPNKGKRKVLFKLPPIWSEVSTINHLGEQAMAVNRWYANALNRFSPVSSERERATDAMRAVVRGMVDENRLKKDIIEYSRIMNKFEKITNKNNDESNKSLNDKRSAIIDEHVWEED